MCIQLPCTTRVRLRGGNTARRGPPGQNFHGGSEALAACKPARRRTVPDDVRACELAALINTTVPMINASP